MENQPLPPNGNINGSVVGAAATEPFAPSAPGSIPLNTGAPLSSAHMYAPTTNKKRYTVILTILLILVSAIAILFVWLYIQKNAEYQSARTDVDTQIDAAVAMARAETTTKMEEEFAEREKYPYRNFAGPADYGSLGFEYPQTWSVYIDRDVAEGGDFEAYLNPVEVQPVSNETINALRVTIRDEAFDYAIRDYNDLIAREDSTLTFTTRNVGGTLANLYLGTLPNGIRGAMAAFKLRDKTVMLQTDSELFIDEFYKLLDTVTFNN